MRWECWLTIESGCGDRSPNVCCLWLGLYEARLWGLKGFRQRPCCCGLVVSPTYIRGDVGCVWGVLPSISWAHLFDIEILICAFVIIKWSCFNFLVLASYNLNHVKKSESKLLFIYSKCLALLLQHPLGARRAERKLMSVTQPHMNTTTICEGDSSRGKTRS